MAIIATAITLEQDAPPPCGAKFIVRAHGAEAGDVEKERESLGAAVKSIRESCHVSAWSEIDGIGIVETTTAEMAKVYQSKMRMGDRRRVFAIDPEAARARLRRAAWLHGQTTALQGSVAGHAISSGDGVAGMDAQENRSAMASGNPWKDRHAEFPHLHGAWESGFLEGMGEIHGMAAFGQGKAREGNPHVQGSPQWRGWDAGWVAASAEHPSAPA